MNRKLVKQLKNLRSIKPARTWSESTREILLSQIRAQEVIAPARVPVLSAVWAYVGGGMALAFQVVAALFASPMVMAASLMVFVTGSTSAVYVSQNTTPGDVLYAVKLTKEQVQVALATDPGARAQIELDLVTERLSELQTVGEKELSNEERQQQVDGLTSSVAQRLSNVNDKLDSIKKIGNAHSAVRLADAVVQRTGEYEKTLKNTNNQKLNTAIDNTQNKALAVLVDNKVAGGVSDDAVASGIKDKIAATEDKIAQIKVTMAAQRDTATDKDMTQKSEDATKTLDEARAQLAKKDYSNALSKVVQSAGLVAEMNVKLDAAAVAKEVPGVEPQKTPTTPPLKEGDVHMKVSF